MEITRRGFLKGMVATTGAIAGGVLEEEIHGLPEIPPPEKKLSRFQKSFDTDSALRTLAQKPVVGDKNTSRHQYFSREFSKGIAKNLPNGVKNCLSLLIPGIVAQETRFNNHRKSAVGAAGMGQVLPSTFFSRKPRKKDGREFVLEEELEPWNTFCSSLKIQSAFIFKHFDENIFPHLSQKVDFEIVKSHFALTQTELDNFVALCCINAYQCGQGCMEKVINTFLESFSLGDFPHHYDHSGISLFNIMSSASVGQGIYGKDSSEYALKVVAGARSLGEKLETNYGIKKPENPSFMQKTLTTLSKGKGKGLKPAIAGVLGGAIGASMVEATVPSEKTIETQNPKVLKILYRFTEFVRNTTLETIKSFHPSFSEERRRILQGITAAGVAGILASATTRNKKNVIDFFSFPEPLNISEKLESLRKGEKYSNSEVPLELLRLASRGIRITSSRKGYTETGTTNTSGRTSLSGMRKDVMRTAESFLSALGFLKPNDESVVTDLWEKASKQDFPSFLNAQFLPGTEKIEITGLAESADHSQRKHGHSGGYALDFDATDAKKIAKALIKETVVETPTTRKASEDHPLVDSDLLVGDKIFRYHSKYFLFGIKNEGKAFVCYFDSESDHAHFELIPWEDYNQNSRNAFKKIAKLPPQMAGIWRKEVRDHLHANL